MTKKAVNQQSLFNSEATVQSFSADQRLNVHSITETCTDRLMKRKMNEEMLHYSARVRCGY